MENKDLDILVQKYVEAQTTPEEELVLKSALAERNDEYDDLQALFGYFSQQKSIKTPQFVNPAFQESTPVKRKVISMQWVAAAAAIAIMVVAFFYFIQSNAVTSADTFTDPQLAAENALKALEILSSEINRGQSIAADQLKEFENLNKYLNIF